MEEQRDTEQLEEDLQVEEKEYAVEEQRATKQLVEITFVSIMW